MSDAAVSSERRARLNGLKLQALIRSRLGADAAIELLPFPLGAGATAADQLWVLLDSTNPEGGVVEAAADGRGFGACVVWATRQGAPFLNVVVDNPVAASVIARRAGEVTLDGHADRIEVWTVEGSELRPVPVVPSVVGIPADPEHLALSDEIEAAGASVVVEHGVVAGEVRGLEVCRVVTVKTDQGPVTRLEVGVGAHDREAFALIHGDVPTRDALAGVVQSVTAVRSRDVPGHPLNRLSAERLLRWECEQHPEALGLVSLHPAEPPVPRPNLKDRTPCTAIGERPDGTPVLVVFSTGVDLDVIPYATDARLAHEPGIGDLEVLVVTPARDRVAATEQLASATRRAVTLVASPDDVSR